VISIVHLQNPRKLVPIFSHYFQRKLRNDSILIVHLLIQQQPTPIVFFILKKQIKEQSQSSIYTIQKQPTPVIFFTFEKQIKEQFQLSICAM
jgi:hypothetical protein